MESLDAELRLDFAKMGGLVPAVVQDVASGEVLMVAFINQEAFELTRKTGRMHYFSRSKNRIWMKGETSGHIQEVVETLVDCDQDALVFKVRQGGGAACHTGYRSCFYRTLDRQARLPGNGVPKVFDPKQVYGT
jgi:phosphoribosyl-AMP cyclohydrolase